MPVSEAVQRLEMEGYLVSVPRRGTQVRVPSREDLRGQFWLREAIECQSARLYAGAIVQHAFDELLPLAEAADSFAVEHAAAWQRDWDFHRALVQLPQVPSLINVFDRTVRLVQFHCIALLPNYPTSRTESHTLLLRDLTQPDADAAESRLRQHLRVGLEHIWN
jgi:DNA-binding GntR family transcriptional regulator